MRLIIIESVLLCFSIMRHETLQVPCLHATGISDRADKIKHIPDIASPDKITLTHIGINHFMILALKLLRIIINLWRFAIENRIAVYTVL